MRRLTTITMACVLTCLMCLMLPGVSLAAGDQQAPATSAQNLAAQNPQGPLVLQPIKTGWIIVPEVKIAEVDRKEGTLVGGYGGWEAADTVFIGAGGYWLANHPNNIEMAYGGLVVGWIVPSTTAIRFGAHALVGVGQARVPVVGIVPLAGPMHIVYRPDYDGRPIYRLFAHEDFFVFEPQADLVIRLADWMHLSCGVGYRLIGVANGLDGELRGVSGSISVRFGGGS
jgi:hypothetical protein